MDSTPLDFQDYSARVQKLLAEHYGIAVITRDIPDPLIGDLDGAEIHVDHAVTPEQRLFLLAHLFGHTVQWNTHPAAFGLGQLLQPPVDPAILPGLLEYEREAAGFGLQLLHEAGIRDADQWLSDFSACDLAYLEHFYLTGEKRDPLTFWCGATPLAAARPIPPFTPTRMVFRTTGVVI